MHMNFSRAYNKSDFRGGAQWMLFALGVIACAAFPAVAATMTERGAIAPAGFPNGRLTGKVALAGGYQPARRRPVIKNRQFCGDWVPDESLLLSTHGGVANAVVLLRPLDRSMGVEPRPTVLDNRNCAFTPHVQIALVGSPILLKNSDPILHTVHARLGKETLFNVGLPRWREVTKPLDRTGIIRIDCDVLHTWMSAVIVVTATPYFAVSDRDGRFTIDDLPPGNYQLEVWHERLGAKSTKISVLGDTTISLDVVYGL